MHESCSPICPYTDHIATGIEAQVDFVADTIERAEQAGTRLVEVLPEGEQAWSQLCAKLAVGTLFWEADGSWIFGTNIPGKKKTLRFFFGGMSGYLKELEKCVREGYPGFRPFLQQQQPVAAASQLQPDVPAVVEGSTASA